MVGRKKRKKKDLGAERLSFFRIAEDTGPVWGQRGGAAQKLIQNGVIIITEYTEMQIIKHALIYYREKEDMTDFDRYRVDIVLDKTRDRVERLKYLCGIPDRKKGEDDGR